LDNNFTYRQINLAPPQMANWIEERIIHNGLWVFNEVTSSVGENVDANDQNILETHQFTNTYFTQEEGPGHNLFGEIAQPLLWMLEKETGLVVDGLVRIKANLLNQHPEFTKDNYHIPHIDHGSNHCVSMVYYVNESDGDTRLFDHYVEDGPFDMKMIHSNTPKKGNALFFQSHRFHASSNPVDSKSRCIINFVFSVTPNSLEQFLAKG